MKKVGFWLGVVIFGFVVGLIIGLLAPLPAPPGTSVPQMGWQVEASTNNPMPAIVATEWFIELPVVVTMLVMTVAANHPLAVRRYWPPLYGRPPGPRNLLV